MLIEIWILITSWSSSDSSSFEMSSFFENSVFVCYLEARNGDNYVVSNNRQLR
jgi:hypothetical protein